MERVRQAIVSCTRCPRLTEYRQRVSQERPRRFFGWEYWSRPLPGFGDPEARVLVLGLAPAAHGGNRTGRMFTGDLSGEWLYGTLYQFGFASAPTSQHRNDSLALHDVYIAAALRCAPPENKPLRSELANCRPYLLRELGLLRRLRVVVALGKIAFDTYLAALQDLGGPLPQPRPRFAHGARYDVGQGVTLIASYHPSQRNTRTGLLTRAMFEGVFSDVRKVLDDG